MPGNTKSIVKDVNGQAAPQYFNPTADAYEYATGSNGAMNVQLTGSYATIKSAPVTGVKTVTSIAAEIFAGASRLPGRRKMIIKNESTTMRIRLGSSTLNVQNGFPVEPTAIFEFDFDPNTAVAIYAISESGNVEVAVIEV